MKAVFYMFLLACSVLLGGCCRARQTQEHLVPTKKRLGMVQIDNFTLTDKTLTLDYEVSNPFDDDIWVCEDINPRAPQHVTTRIDDKWVRIKVRLYHEGEPLGFLHPPGFGKYLQLPPGESHSGKILLELPLKDRLRESLEPRKKHKEVVLHRAVFEVGYFGPRFAPLFEGMFKQPFIPGLTNEMILTSYQLPTSVVVVQETRDGKPRKVAYVRRVWAELRLEESAKVPISDVDIPCSVVVDDE